MTTDDKRRLHPRTPANARLQLCWHDPKAGHSQVRAHAVDTSEFGVRVEAEKSVPSGTLVVVYTPQGVVVGRGSVRHSTPKGWNYLIGLYLPNRLARAI